VESLYDGEIRHVDDGVAALLDALERSGAAEDTLVVITGDHGEVMTRNGIYFDHHGLYEENIRVPLLMRWPGGLPAGRREPRFVQQHDFAPTLLRWAGGAVPDGMEGKDFSGLATGASDEPLWERVICCESTWQSKWAFRTDTHKLILSRAPDRYGTPMRELYDLVADPGETRNMAETEPDLADNLERSLEEWIAAELKRLGRDEDPLRTQGITLGKKWDGQP
jgi:arylsulfatase A-like enzyme